MLPAARNFFDGFSMAMAALVAVGVWIQVYLIGSYLFGADALDAHEDVGLLLHGLEALTLLGALLAWRGRVDIGLAFLLLLVGTGQIGFSDGDEWVGGVHALLALLVLVIAVFIVKRGLVRRSTPTQAARA